MAETFQSGAEVREPPFSYTLKDFFHFFTKEGPAFASLDMKSQVTTELSLHAFVQLKGKYGS